MTKVRVLIADDDPTLVDMYSARISAEGFDVITAKDGQEMMARAVEANPDVILSDLKMPGVNGFDGIEILKNTTETKNVPVIVLTAFPNPEFKDRVSKAGAAGYLIKSEVTPAQVVEKIKEVLKI